MIVFVIFAALLTLAAAAVLARPLLRRMAPPAPPAEHGQAVYRDQLAELERDVARGLVSRQEETAARAEIGRRMLAAGRAEGETPAPAPAPSAPARILAGLAVVAMLGAALLYMAVGRPGAPDRPLQARLDAGETRSEGTTPQLEAAIAELSDRARRNPDDFEAQLMLGRGLAQAGRYEDAMAQYQRAVEAAGDDATAVLLSEYGQVRVMALGAVDNEAVEAFRDALEIDPQNPQARFFLGVALAQAEEYALALQLWSQLLEDLPADSPMANAVRGEMQRAQRAAAAAPDNPADGEQPAE